MVFMQIVVNDALFILLMTLTFHLTFHNFFFGKYSGLIGFFCFQILPRINFYLSSMEFHKCFEGFCNFIPQIKLSRLETVVF